MFFISDFEQQNKLLKKFSLNCAPKNIAFIVLHEWNCNSTVQDSYIFASIFRLAQVAKFWSKSLLSFILINVMKHVWHHKIEVFKI